MKRKAKSKYIKYISIALVAIFLIAAAFLIIELWENKQGRFDKGTGNDSSVEYNDQEYEYKQEIETFLVLGIDEIVDEDSKDENRNGVYADFLMLFVFDNETKQFSAIQINRDTMTKVNRLSVGGTSVIASDTMQIALAYNYVNDDNDRIRCRNTKDSVEYLLNGIKIDHYMSVTMDSVPKSCDLVGGVEVEVLDDFTGIDDSLVKGEKVTLKGEQALRYVRTRYGLEDSSNSTRMKRQQQYIQALYDKISYNIKEDEEFLIKFVDQMDEYVEYDSSNNKIMKFAEKFENYEFLGIRELEGEQKVVNNLMEFYPNEDSISEVVIELFYTEK